MKTQKNPLKIALYLDGADKEPMIKRYQEGLVGGFTTNPSLMAKAGIRDYVAFAKEILKAIPDMPISFEVFSDEFEEMEREALEIGSWGPNVYIKIPITNTKGIPTYPLIRKLFDKKLKLNITALFTEKQLKGLLDILRPEDDAIISIFAGRIADTGVDPMPLMKKAVQDFAPCKNSKILWASTREAVNMNQAEACGCHIITVPDDILNKLNSFGKSLEECSLDTVKGFYKDATKAGFKF